MTKKDYELIAKQLKSLYNPSVGIGEYCMYYAVVEGLADAFSKNNPRFDKETFFNACGLDYEEYLDFVSMTK